MKEPETARIEIPGQITKDPARFTEQTHLKTQSPKPTQNLIQFSFLVPLIMKHIIAVKFL